MRVTALICDRSASPGAVDIASPGVDVTLVPDLCRHPRAIAQAGGASRLVLGVCPGEANLGALQAEARRAGIDALGVEMLLLGDADRDAHRLSLRIAGAAARARAFDGDETLEAKLVLPPRPSRREVLGFARPWYLPAPSVDHSRCVVGHGCRSCVEACPAAALEVADGEIRRDRDACVACGRCVTACPAGAVHNPGVSPTQLHSQVRALLDPGPGPLGGRGIVFTCRRSRATHPSGWYPVTIPCTTMLTPAWLLAPLAMGAGAVAATQCPDGGCHPDSSPGPASVVTWCRAALGGMGLSAERVSSAAHAPPPAPLGRVPLRDPFGPLGAAEVLIALADLAPSVGLAPIEAEGSPLGFVEISDDACTLCGTCGQTCPTGALAVEHDAGTATISFDHARCTGCGLCVDRCPESGRGAISMSRRADLRALHQGRALLAEDGLITCRSCGSTITTAKVMDRIEELLGDQPKVLDHAARYCLACRGSKTGPPMLLLSAVADPSH